MDLGFLGPNEGQRVVSRHLLESAALLPHLPPDDPVVDVGSGAGLPGLVLAALGRRVILIESQAKRVDFLRRSSAEIDVAADVRHARAEDEGRGDLPRCRKLGRRPRARRSGRRVRALPAAGAAGRSAPLAGVAGLGRRRSCPMPGAETRSARRRATGSGPEESARAERELESACRMRRRDAEVTRRGRRGWGRGQARGRRGARRGLVRWQELSVPGADGPRWVMIVDKVRSDTGSLPSPTRSAQAAPPWWGCCVC